MFSNANVLFKTKFVDGASTVTRHVQRMTDAMVDEQKERASKVRDPVVGKPKKKKKRVDADESDE